MRKLCPNLERDDALDTVLEVPIPEEMFSGGGGGSRGSRSRAMSGIRSDGAGDPGISPGLDPMLTASLFAEDSVCIGERSIDGEDCFVLKVEAEASSLRARNSSSVEIIRHTVWGYFSQRTGLLVQLEDSHLLQIKSGAGGGSVFWETTMESRLRDYRAVDGVNIAHSGRTAVSLVRFGDTHDGGNTRTRMEEHWDIEEVDFNIWGLSMDCFLPPSDLRDAKESQQQQQELAVVKAARPPPLRIPAVAVVRVGPSQVAAVNLDETESLLAR
uniref:Uncharacterized protein n=1 Tax=Aegilops tauschii TaxID=37682 RepID=M8C0S9_AEGTA